MAGITKRRTSPASTSSSSGDVLPQRVTRKRRSARRGPRSTARRPSAPPPMNELDLNTAALDPDHYATGLRVLLQKELRNSDVSQLGRIVLPKKEAESYLPILMAKDGKSLCMHDLLNSQLWTFKYRYWFNNKSRMYVLENTGDYVKAHDLQQGDFIVIYKDDENNRFVIGAKKAGDEQTATVPQVHEHMHISAALPAPQAFHDYAGPVAAEAGMLAIVPQGDEIFDGILNSLPALPEIPVANVRYSDFFDPFGDSMDMANPLSSSNNPSVNLATHFHDERIGSCSFPYPKSGPQM
uniref:ABI19 n=1 Tax=Zea mays TaxID=4577 RepID=A0A8A5XAZ0_MAIZE|nr:ABI19 [Zea mays]